MGFVKWASEHLGKSNKPVYTVAAVAVFKGIFRPMFTMMDKKQDPATKKYAAVREGATELIAIPTYIGLSFLTEKLAPAFSPNGKTVDQLLHSTKSTLGFFGVCFAALYAIPKLCNLAMPSIMKALNMDKSKHASKSQVVVTPQASVTADNNIDKQSSLLARAKVESPYAKTPINQNGGMRV